jgi:glycosyltransferase involved in cell wall biosynthesis
MVVAVFRVKDEADIIVASVTRMLGEVDCVVVQDNASTDGTRDLLADLARGDERVKVLDDPDIAYMQSRKMSTLAAFAAQELGAAWVIPADADERWYSPHGRIADVLADHPDASIASAELYDHVATARDPGDGDPITRIGWRRREPAPLPKVAVRPYPRVTIHQGNHSASYGDTVDDLLVVRHFALRSPEQMIRKARNGGAAYAATDLPEHVGAHWRQWNQLSDEQLGEVFRTYYWSPRPESDPSLIFDPAP